MTKNTLVRLIDAVTGWALELKPVRAFLLFTERRGPMLADSVTYRALFSVFAGLLLGFSVAGLWLAGNPVAWQAVLDAVQAAVPGLIGEGAVVDPSALGAPFVMSLTGLISLAGLIGAALGAIGALHTAVRLLAGTAQKDVFWVWATLRDFALAVAISVSFIVSAGVVFAGQWGIAWITALLGRSADGDGARFAGQALSVGVVYALDVLLVVGVFLLLAELKVSARSLWSGALLGGIGLLALQELSALFVSGAGSNPLLASFASLLALLAWLNLSAQVILIACAYIVVGHEEDQDRVRSRFGATTFAQRRVQRAEVDVMIATAALREAQNAAASERAQSAK